MIGNFTEKERKLLVTVGVFSAIMLFLPGFVEKEAVTYKASQDNRKSSLEDKEILLDGQLSGIEDQRRLLIENRENYERWVDKGVVGEQDMVSRLKTVDDIRNKRKFYQMEYDVSLPQTVPSGGSPMTEDSTVNIKILKMDFKLPMLHDMDSLMLLQSMREDIDAFFFPLQCEYTRNEAEFALIHRPNMSSFCSIGWFYIEDPESRLLKEGDQS